MAKTDKSKDRAIQTLYQLIPNANCKGLCQQFCGPIMMSRHERQTIIKTVGVGPKADSKDRVCNMLDRETGKCKIYDIRPGICRVWATTPETACPYGCKPDDPLNETEARLILTALEEVGGKPHGAK